ncbi:Ig-like domain-containing protein [Reichenbachiella carrageenanivorans]|uniref:Ig-like domain-containing protein n=1 Tax=Reichenbachiella carrageenanivorans TaxID=2979869 RepID=A0ABY6D5B5_9BACT|nr:Ig-like domain-containing protein [Reichenbachiella carrageenanivorans]UXX81004.1 Ig-like domain-containing protein [Reichenbachiella carrageenanivorans]
MDYKYNITTTHVGKLALACLVFLGSFAALADDPACPEKPNLVQAGFYPDNNDPNIIGIWPWALTQNNGATGTLEAEEAYVGNLTTTVLNTGTPALDDILARQSFTGLKKNTLYEVTIQATAPTGSEFKVNIAKFFGNYWPVANGSQATFTAADDAEHEYSYQFTTDDQIFNGMPAWATEETASFRIDVSFGTTVGSLIFHSPEVREVSNDCIAPTAVSISNCPSEDLYLGAPLDLQVSFEPENTDATDITWTSSDNTVVKVENGALVIVAAGDATITATTFNNLTATCSVTVLNENVETCTHPEIVLDGGFDVDASHWEYYRKPETAAAGTMSLETTAGMTGNALKVEVTGVNDPANESDHQLKQRMSVLYSGYDYTLKFKAKADAERSIKVKVIPNQAPWPGSLDESIDLTTTTQDFEFNFTYSLADRRSVSIDFFLGQVLQTVWIDDVSLIATSGDCYKATSINILDCPDSNIDILDEAQLGVIVGPEYATYNTAQWSTSDNSIATVNGNGLVTGVIGGTVDIVATSTYYSDLQGTCSVTVNPKAVETISVAGCSLDEKEAGDKVTLSYFVEPSDAGDLTATWSSSDETIATVNESGVVTFVGNGEVTITATSNQDATKTASCTMTAEGGELVTAVGGSQIKGLSIYPNPLTGSEALTILSDSKSPMAVTVMELNGKVVYSQKFDTNENAVISRKRFGHAGLYLVRIENNLGSTVRKVQVD